MKSVAKLMKECDDIIVGECCGLSTNRWSEITSQQGNGCLDIERGRISETSTLDRDYSTAPCIIHPRTTAFCAARIEIEIDMAD